MRATILGLGEWRGRERRGNDHWPEEIVQRWRDRTGGVDDTLATVPLGARDPATARNCAEEAHDPFLRSTVRYADGDGTSASAASAIAARRALDDAGIRAEDLDAVLASDGLPDRPSGGAAPRTALLAGAPQARAILVDAGCAASIVQLELATALVESGRARHVLCTQSHLLWRAFPLAHPALPLISDMATAFVVGPSESRGVLGLFTQSHGDLHDAVCWTRGRDDQSDTPWWSPGGPFVLGSRDRGRARGIIEQTVSYGIDAVERAIESSGLEPPEADLLVSVQPRRWVPAAIAEGLGLPSAVAVHTFDQIAHVGPCCTVANLLEARRRRMLYPGSVVAVYAQGMGFTRGAAVLRWGAR